MEFAFGSIDFGLVSSLSSSTSPSRTVCTLEQLHLYELVQITEHKLSSRKSCRDYGRQRNSSLIVDLSHHIDEMLDLFLN